MKKIFLAISLLILLTAIWIYPSICQIGIIGGADGPIKIFIAGKIGTSCFSYFVIALLFVGLLIYLLKRK